MYREKIVNVVNGEESFRDYTSAEIAEVEKEQAEASARLALLAAKEEARKALLEKLGITEDEAKLLLS